MATNLWKNKQKSIQTQKKLEGKNPKEHFSPHPTLTSRVG